MLNKISEYLAENVLRSIYHESSIIPSRPPRDGAMPTLSDYDPSVVNVEASSGGFHSIVQISARHSLRIFKDYVPETIVRKCLLGEAFEEYIASQTTPFDDGYLNRFHAGLANMVGLRLTLTPARITFEESSQLVVKFNGDLELYNKNV